MVKVNIKTKLGSQVSIDVDSSAWHIGFEVDKAIKNDSMIRLESDSGRTVFIRASEIDMLEVSKIPE